MLTRNLDNTPAANEITLFAESLTKDILEEGYRDCGQVMLALRYVSRHQDRWPTTNQVLLELRSQNATPPRMYQPYLRLPEPTYERSPECTRMVREALQQFKERMG